MTKEELRKEFNIKFRNGRHFENEEIFDWFYSKIEDKDEKYNSLKQSHQDVVNRCNELEEKLKAADEVILEIYNYSAKKENNLTKALKHYKSLK